MNEYSIVKSCEKDQNGHIKNWPKHVELAAFADRITVSSVTGYSPYYLLHGTHPLLPFDLVEATFMVEGFQSGISTEELLALRIRQLQRHPEDLNKAANALKQARFRSKQQFEKRYWHKLQRNIYNEGQLVLIRNSRLEATVAKFKTEPRYLGPYEVIRRTKRGTYILKELDGAEHAEHYAAFRLIPYVTRRDIEFQDLMTPVNEDRDSEYQDYDPNDPYEQDNNLYDSNEEEEIDINQENEIIEDESDDSIEDSS